MNIVFVENIQIYKKFTNIKTVGGIETNTNDIIQEMLKRGHNVWVFNKQITPKWAEDGHVDIIAASNLGLNVRVLISPINTEAIFSYLCFLITSLEYFTICSLTS